MEYYLKVDIECIPSIELMPSDSQEWRNWCERHDMIPIKRGDFTGNQRCAARLLVGFISRRHWFKSKPPPQILDKYKLLEILLCYLRIFMKY